MLLFAVDEVNRATLRTTTNPKLTVAYEEEKLSGVGIVGEEYRASFWLARVLLVFSEWGLILRGDYFFWR
eukprot:scaffold79_cov71-Skeletonema_dohrnii-CCMP3373.AAC.2